MMSLYTYPERIVFFQKVIDQKISLKDEFRLERKMMRGLPENDPRQHYLSAEMQDFYAIDNPDKNLFFNIQGTLLNGEYNFVLTCEEDPKLLCDKVLHHSSLANGKKVLACGTLVFKDGILIEITNNSGHYRPTDEEMLAVINALYTESRGTLIHYISYCTSEPQIYSVAELEYCDNFTAVTPLAERMNVNTVNIKKDVSSTCEQSGETSKLSPDYDEKLVELNKTPKLSSDYDEKLVALNNIRVSAPVDGEEPKGKNIFSKRRFGKNMSEELITNYKEFLGKNTFFPTNVDLIEEHARSLNITFP